MNVRLVSPWYPLMTGVTSTLMMSPSRKTCSSLGMPWQTTWLTDVQQLLGKGCRLPLG